MAQIRCHYRARFDGDGVAQRLEKLAYGMTSGTLQVLSGASIEVDSVARAGLPHLQPSLTWSGSGDAAEFTVAIDGSFIDLRGCGLSLLLNFVLGDICGPAYGARELRLLNIEFDPEMLAQLPGPRFGPEALARANPDRPRGPWFGLLMKPNLGAPPSHYGDLAHEAALGGVDYIKEDELLVNPPVCPMMERVKRVVDGLERARARTGHRVVYSPNVSVRPDRLVETARQCLALGASGLMLNVFAVGFSMVTALAERDDLGVPLHLHRSIYDVFTRNPIGMAPEVASALMRLAGGDLVHIGPPFAVFPDETVRAMHAAVTDAGLGVAPALPVITRMDADTVDPVLELLRDTRVLLIADAPLYRGSVAARAAEFVRGRARART
ncbi:MAG: hypothetical protein HYY05_04890 [Chloroflexi bacterium]|nr:hypothetical protein [Chloroflexota bacterium]